MSAKRLAIVVAVTALCAGGAAADSVSYAGNVTGTYYYNFSTAGIDAGETVVFTNLEGITDAQASTPASWNVTWSPYDVTYTWTGADNNAGLFLLQFDSAAPPGTVQYQVNTDQPIPLTDITGPQYVPEPTTFAMMGAGLIGMLGFVTLRRRRKP